MRFVVNVYAVEQHLPECARKYEGEVVEEDTSWSLDPTERLEGLAKVIVDVLGEQYNLKHSQRQDVFVSVFSDPTLFQGRAQVSPSYMYILRELHAEELKDFSEELYRQLGEYAKSSA